LTLSKTSPLLLASGSPRRRELCEALGLPIVTHVPVVDEGVVAGEDPVRYLERIAAQKLAAARAGAGAIAHAAVLVADTIVVCEGEVVDKPDDLAQRVTAVERLAGRAHEVKTRFVLELRDGRARVAETVTTRVFVRSLPPAWIRAYAATAEGADKAGGYAIQGRFAFAIGHIVGSYSNVVGLPQAEVVAALDTLGLLPVFPLP
jgi:septum formation protein